MAGADRRILELVAADGRASTLAGDLPERRDGLLWRNGSQWEQFVSAAFTSTRAAAGDYRITRTAGGAETHFLLYAPTELTRRQDGKGLKVIGFALAYIVGVVALTTLTLTPSLTTYADATAPSVATYGGTTTFDPAHDTDAERKATGTHLLEIMFADPKFLSAPNAQTAREHAQFSFEIAIVMANTGTFALLGGGALVAHDYV
jgi:hypothetical protein